MLNLLTVNKLLAHRPWEVTPEHMKVREWGEGEGGGERREGGSKGRGEGERRKGKEGVSIGKQFVCEPPPS